MCFQRNIIMMSEFVYVKLTFNKFLLTKGQAAAYPP